MRDIYCEYTFLIGSRNGPHTRTVEITAFSDEEAIREAHKQCWSYEFVADKVRQIPKLTSSAVPVEPEKTSKAILPPGAKKARGTPPGGVQHRGSNEYLESTFAGFRKH